MTTATKLMTAEELMALPDDGWRYELVGGVPRRRTMGGLDHGRIGARILSPVFGFVERHDLGLVVYEVLFRFERNPDHALVPDMAFVRGDRLPPPDAWQRVAEMPPDLVLDVASPDDTAPEIAAKVAYYLDHGVSLVWVAYPPRREVVVHRPGQAPRTLGAGDVLDGEEILPGFQLPLTRVFA